MISKSDRHTEELNPRMLCMKNKGKARKKIGEVPGFGNKYIAFPRNGHPLKGMITFQNIMKLRKKSRW